MDRTCHGILPGRAAPLLLVIHYALNSERVIAILFLFVLEMTFTTELIPSDVIHLMLKHSANLIQRQYIEFSKQRFFSTTFLPL